MNYRDTEKVHTVGVIVIFIGYWKFLGILTKLFLCLPANGIYLINNLYIHLGEVYPFSTFLIDWVLHMVSSDALNLI